MSMDEPETDLDTLMSQDPLSLSNQDLDRIIAYQRKMRGLREAGVRTKKPKAEAGAAPKLDLATLMAKPAKESSSFKRRV